MSDERYGMTCWPTSHARANRRQAARRLAQITAPTAPAMLAIADVTCTIVLPVLPLRTLLAMLRSGLTQPFAHGIQTSKEADGMHLLPPPGNRRKPRSYQP